MGDQLLFFAPFSNQRKANKKEAMELDNEIESRLSAAQTTLTIQVGQTSWYVGYDVSARHVVLCRQA